MEFYAAEKKKELIPFATAWMKLESIMLSEISQEVRDKYHMISSGFQSFTPIPTIKLGHSGAGSQVSGPVHTVGPCGSLQQPLL